MTKKLLKIFLATLVFAALLMVGWYQIDGIPTEGTTAYMSGAGYAVAETEDGALLFTPSASNGYGIAMMHGALILPQSYAKSAAYFAKLGYTVYLPSGPARLSIGAVDSTAQYIQESALDGWFFIGHSMGGMSSLETISRHRIDARAVALWATAMPSDYSDVEAPILFIWGDSDGLLPEERFHRSQDNLPKNVEYLTLKGANHKNFAMYSHQFFDSEAKMDWMEQIDFANQTTAEFFALYK